jgi:predicted DNA-binding transcriptional regulator AlpA
MSASKKRPPTTRLVGDAPVLIEGEGGLVVVKGQQTSFPAPAIEPPADDPEPKIGRERVTLEQFPRPPPLGPMLLLTPRVRVFFGGVSTMWIERRLADDASFPRPRYIAGKRYWEVEELTAWVEAQPREAPDWVIEAGPRGKAAARARRASMAQRTAQKQEQVAPPPSLPVPNSPSAQCRRRKPPRPEQPYLRG